MTVPEWIVVGVATIFCVVVWWGIRELVAANKQTGEALSKIRDLLAGMDTRLATSETWMELHEKQDDERHQETKKSHEAMWDAINGLRV